MSNPRQNDLSLIRALWSSVVIQAVQDLQTEPLHSHDYNAAVAFFTGGGPWRESRQAIADFLDRDVCELERAGRREIARRAASGTEPDAGGYVRPSVRRPKEQRRPIRDRSIEAFMAREGYAAE